MAAFNSQQHGREADHVPDSSWIWWWMVELRLSGRCAGRTRHTSETCARSKGDTDATTIDVGYVQRFVPRWSGSFFSCSGNGRARLYKMSQPLITSLYIITEGSKRYGVFSVIEYSVSRREVAARNLLAVASDSYG